MSNGKGGESEVFFNGEVVVITGAAQGIGRAMAEKFCKEGARAAIVDVNEEKGILCAKAIQAAGGDAHFFKCDVMSVDEISNCIKSIEKTFGHIDILINNAGILHTTSIEDVTEEEWDRIMAVNLKSVFFMSQKVIPYMKKAGGGSILNISSLAGRMGGYANGLAYTASKAGIIGLTYGFANRLAKYNINVNAIAPGTTETDILNDIPKNRLNELKASIPLGRFGMPEDIADAAVFLTSSRAGFITGAVLDVNGGMFVG
ncbi:MAG: SDR family oxidoreductase [Clostridia bacterium]|nr:SDR family oxidoreductase [Clostridia bacterium]MBN2882883.1 SDR family oxidoreductase [Clostridia bacterium]